jgi:hypothetical protein
MAIIFPSQPHVNEIFTADNGHAWRWNGYGWQNLGLQAKTFATDISSAIKKVAETMDKETPEGKIDNVNRTYTLKSIPVPGSEYVFLNGMLQNSGLDQDYMMVNNNIVMNHPINTDSIIACTYTYIGSIDIINEIALGKNDGTNNKFSLRHNVKHESERVFLNGMLQTSGSDMDYMIEDNYIIFAVNTPDNSIVSCTYSTKI